MLPVSFVKKKKKKKKHVGFSKEEHLEDSKIMIENDAFGAIMATINVDNGLNAVMKTGPFSLIANVWTFTVIPKITTPWKKKIAIELAFLKSLETRKDGCGIQKCML